MHQGWKSFGVWFCACVDQHRRPNAAPREGPRRGPPKRFFFGFSFTKTRQICPKRNPQKYFRLRRIRGHRILFFAASRRTSSQKTALRAISTKYLRQRRAARNFFNPGVHPTRKRRGKRTLQLCRLFFTLVQNNVSVSVISVPFLASAASFFALLLFGSTILVLVLNHTTRYRYWALAKA